MLYYSITNIPYVGEQNDFKQSIRDFIAEKNYNEAINQYELLITKSSIIQPAIRYNLGLLYQQKGLTQKSKQQFLLLINNSNKDLLSIAYAQLGFISSTEKDTAQALLYFRKSLQIDENNQLSRYNYELLKKSYTPPVNNSTQNEQQSQKEIAQAEEKRENLKKLNQDSLSEEKALQILEAMKNQEIQYIQQRRRNK